MKLTKEQVMVANGMKARGTFRPPIRVLLPQLLQPVAQRAFRDAELLRELPHTLLEGIRLVEEGGQAIG